MTVRHTTEKIKDDLYSCGFIFLDEKYKDANKKVNIESIADGYRYYVYVRQAKVSKNLYRFSTINPHSIYNINLLMKKEEIFGIIATKMHFNGKYTIFHMACEKCKEEWGDTPQWLINRKGCPFCLHIRPSKFYNLATLYPHISDEWDNKNDKNPEDYLPSSNESVYWSCKKCGNKWKSPINCRTRSDGSGCPKCAKSKGEKSIELILKERDVSYLPQYRFDDCKHIRYLWFDFAVFKDVDKKELDFLIEYDGELHFRPYHARKDSIQKLQERQFLDNVKTNYCLNKNIKLIRIPYWEKNNIPDILNEILVKGGYKFSG